MNEEWKDVVGYKGLYKVSNLGRVKSLDRRGYIKAIASFGIRKERILKPCINARGYLHVSLCENGGQKTRRIHQLVAESFLNHTRFGRGLVINHIDFNKFNNNVSNLEIITIRENSNLKHIKSSSKYVGVSKRKSCKKWVSRITIGKKTKHLGYFKNELEASKAYQKELKQIKLL